MAVKKPKSGGKTESLTKVFAITIGQIKWGFRSTDTAYPSDIRKGLGVEEVPDTTDGLVIGANRPKPVRVRFNLANGKSVMRWCDPSKIESVVFKNELAKKQISGQNINSVTLVTG